MKTLQPIIYILLALATLVGAASYVGIAGFIAWGFFVGLPLTLWIAERRKRVMQLRQLAQQKDNIYIQSEWPGDTGVYKRAQEMRRLLKESGNKLNVEVVEIYFQDYVAPTETWDEFLVRRFEVIKEDKARRHQYLNSLQRQWYVQQVLAQEF